MSNSVKSKFGSCTSSPAVWPSLSSHHPLLCPLDNGTIVGVHAAADRIFTCTCRPPSPARSPQRSPGSCVAGGGYGCLSGCVAGVGAALEWLEPSITFTLNTGVILLHSNTQTYTHREGTSTCHYVMDQHRETYKLVLH